MYRSLVSFVAILAAVAAFVCVPAAESRANVGPGLVVSLTFDDGFDNEFLGARILSENGLRGTFYVNSGNIDSPGRLTLPQLKAMASAGHEIAGHTVDHAQLFGEIAGEQLREICDDRVRLASWGFRPKSFAFPYGSSDASAEKAAQTCGYNSARSTGGLLGTSCPSCAPFESIPALNPFHVRAYPSIVNGTSIKTMEAELEKRIHLGAGWIPLVFHQVCDSCGDMVIKPADLVELAHWLVAHERDGVTVKTVDEVVGGDYHPVAVGPYDSRPAGQLVNANLEQLTLSDGGMAGDGSPYCWDRVTYGRAQTQWSKVSGAQPGSSAQQVRVEAIESGDVKLLTRRDLGACSPMVSPDARYSLSSLVHGSGPVQFVVFVADSNGHWRFVENSPPLETTDNWNRINWSTGPLPSDAHRMAFGIRVTTPGTLAVDDFAMTQDGSTAMRLRAAAVGCVAAFGLVGLAALLSIRRQQRPRSAGRHAL